MSADAPQTPPHSFPRTKTTFWLQSIAYAFVVAAGVFWLLSPSVIAVNKLGPYVTPVGGTIATVGAIAALYGHILRRWLPEQIGAALVSLAAGMYAYSIAVDSLSDSTKGMGMCIVAAFFALCVLRIFQIERSTDPRWATRRLSADSIN